MAKERGGQEDVPCTPEPQMDVISASLGTIRIKDADSNAAESIAARFVSEVTLHTPAVLTRKMHLRMERARREQGLRKLSEGPVPQRIP